jgi:hypothetical protein
MMNRFRKVAQDCKLSLVAATADDTDVVVCVFDLHICIYFGERLMCAHRRG